MARYQNGKAGLSASTTVPLGLAAAIVLAGFGTVWWVSSTLTGLIKSVDYLSNDVLGVKNNVSTIQTDVSNMKKSVDRIEWATSSETSKKK